MTTRKFAFDLLMVGTEMTATRFVLVQQNVTTQLNLLRCSGTDNSHNNIKQQRIISSVSVIDLPLD